VSNYALRLWSIVIDAPPSGNIVFSTPAHCPETKRLLMATYIHNVESGIQVSQLTLSSLISRLFANGFL
jgi:hypothetical protein